MKYIPFSVMFGAFLLLQVNAFAQSGQTKDVLGVALEELAFNMKMEKHQKFFAVCDIYLLTIKEALNADTDKELTRRLNVFEFKNQNAIGMIFADLDQWQENLTKEEKIAFNIAFISRDEGKALQQQLMRVRNRVHEDEQFMRMFDKLYPSTF